MDKATQLFGAYAAQLVNCNAPISAVDQLDIDYFLNLCQSKLEKPAFEQAWNVGHALTYEQVFKLVFPSSF